MRKLTLLFACLVGMGMWALQAQTLHVSGTVTASEDGLPIPGVSVVVKGTTLGTITSVEGEYSFQVPDDAQTLVFSFVGMATQEVAISGQTTINVELAPESVDVDEVVVTALGISREKKALGYAVQEVGGESLAESREGNVVSSLSGKVAGVQISGSSGNMGGSARVLIRGANSVTGNNQPLFVVDGVPFDNDNFNSSDAARGAGGIDYGNMAQDINPEDIESVSVLKGASAAALYGSRAANGVIMITTKKGKAQNGVGVSVNTGVTFEKVNLLPKYQKSYGGGSGDFKTVTIDGKEYQTVKYYIDESWGPKYDGQMVLHWDAFDEWDSANYLKPREWKAPENDVEDFFETGVAYNTNVALTGGNETANFRASYTNVTSEGYMPNSEMDKNTIQISGMAKLGERVTMNANAAFVRTNALGRPVTGYDDNNVMQKFTQWGQRQVDMKRLSQYKNSDGSQRSWNRTSWDDATPAYSDNPYWTRYENYNEDTRDRLYGNVGLVYEISDAFSASFKAYKDGYTFRTEDRVAVGSQGTSEYKEAVRQFDEQNYEGMLNFDKRLSETVSFSAHGGFNLMRSTYHRNYASTSGGLALPGLYTPTNSVDAPVVEDKDEKKAVNSVFGSFSLGWKDMAYLDGTFRNDWSSTLPSNNRSYFYPSFTASFILSQLPSLKEISWLSFAKVRAGWAKVGSDTDPYKLVETYSNTWPNFGGVARYSVPNTINNSELKPETTYSWEIGGEFRFFNNRLGVDATYYSMRTEDLITDIALSGATGYLYKVVNAGAMTNKGFEMMLTGTPIQTKDFQWDVTVNYAKNNNELVELMEGIDNYRLANAPFKATVNAFKGAAYGALMGTDYVTDKNGNRLVSTSGRYRKTADVEVLGSVMPDYNMGFSNNFKYKNFDMGVLVDMQKGGQYFSTSYMWGMYSGMLEETVWHDGVDIREEGIVLDAVYGYQNADGSIVYTDKDGNESDSPVKNESSISAERYSGDHYYGPDAQVVFDADYIKLREVTLGYTLPSKFTGPIKNVRVSLYGRNLAVWGLDNQHFDPESAVTSSGNVQGIEGAALPSTSTYGANLKFNF